MIKKILKFTGITLLILIVLAFILPIVFKGKIIAIAKEQINKNVNAKVDFKDVDISFFRHFPKAAVALEGLQVIGLDEFAGDTLVAAKNIDVAMNIVSLIKGTDMKIYSITVNDPRIHAIMHKNGKANWDIAKEDSAVIRGEKEPFSLQLDKYAVNNAYIRYIDETSGTNSEIKSFTHEGTGDFAAEKFVLKTLTEAKDASFFLGGIPYLSNANLKIDLDIEVDNTQNKFSFNTKEIAINNLKISSEGFLKIVDSNTYNMDIAFNAPSTDFKDILSLIPAIYKHGFNDLKTSGQATLNGFVKGTYSPKQIPAYAANLDVKNASFKYPDLPGSVSDINLAVHVNNPDGITDHTVVDIPKAHVKFDNEQFDFRLLLKNPITTQYIDAAVKGKLDLATITRFVKLEEGTRLAGILNADVNVKGNVSDIESARYEAFNAGGTLGISNLLYASKEYPDEVRLSTMQASFNPRNVTISQLVGQYKKTNFDVTGQLNNLLPYVLKGTPLNGSMAVKADKMNLNDWMGTPVSAHNNVPDTNHAATTAPFAVPDNIKFDLSTNIGSVQYDNLTMQNLSGALAIADEKVTFNNIQANALDGTILINGYYSTKQDKKNPDISLSYSLKDLDVQKTFNTFVTAQKLMPIGKFIAGKLNSQLTVNGKLGQDMMPDLKTLTGNGDFLLIEGFLSKFGPLDKLATALSVKELAGLSLKDVKTWFEFTNGKVLVKPFTVKVKDVEMQVGGMHGLDQSLDYSLDLKLPRALMGEKGNSFVNGLVSQANNKGIPVKLGETVNLHAKMGGTITSPTIKTDLKEMAGSVVDDVKAQAVDFAKAKIDSTKKAVKDTVAAVKKELLNDAKDELLKQLSGKKDTGKTTTGVDNTKKNVEEKAKGLLDGLLKKKAKDSTKKQ
jgi:hypothetical protein